MDPRRYFIGVLVSVTCFTLTAANGINWNGNWALGCDFDGNDLSRERVRGEDCGGLCSRTSECTHFTWTDYDRGTCFLKRGPISKANAFESPQPSAVCGVLRGSGDDPSEPVRSGTTTRYWDCCKPSCSWNGKAETSQPVKTCERNGVTRISDTNAQSGCNGGEAYLCNDQAPWVVNDQLAYGFAAASIQGSSESGWCCACYKLKFTSGPVQGKTMIVQVTNTGNDLGNNQFDLQIPGGGVGQYDGCTSQWNNPLGDWGNRYGGVSGRDQCGSLPEPLRAGCYFRFDWFQGADNPNVEFSKVKCPAELEERTQCVRRN